MREVIKLLCGYQGKYSRKMSLASSFQTKDKDNDMSWTMKYWCLSHMQAATTRTSLGKHAV